MSKYYQEFFWNPIELVPWIQKMVSTFDLWVVSSLLQKDSQLVEAGQLQPDQFIGIPDDGIGLYLGSNQLCSPVWRKVNERRLLDFSNSYAVQMIPSILAADRKTLLQGRLAILRLDQYDDPDRAKELSVLFRNLKMDMKQKSDNRRVITQLLSNGQIKTWSDVLIGKQVPDFENVQLKQFTKGAVVFDLKNIGAGSA